MVWVSIILSILSALPQLIAMIQEIWNQVHGHPAQMHAFTTLLLRHEHVGKHSDDGAKAAVLADLHAFHAKHVLGKV